MQRTQDEMNVIAARALLAGLEFGLQRYIEAVNEIRALAVPQAVTSRTETRNKGIASTLNAAWDSRASEPRVEHAPASDQRGHKLTPEGSTAISDGHRAAWAICQKAGLNPKTRPSNEMIERARKILARKKAAA